MKQTIVLKLKVHKPVGVRQKTMETMLARAARLCDQARNAGLRAWELDRRLSPWWPEFQTKADGSLKVWHGNPVYKKEIGPKTKDGVTMGTWIYRKIRDAVPELSSNLASIASKEITAKLKSKMPYDSETESHWFWEAVLKYDVQPPTYRSRLIPVPNKCATLQLSPECRLELPLFSTSDDSGLPRRLCVSLLSGSLTRGQRRWLSKIDKGEAKLSDSYLVPRKGRWFFHATILNEAVSGVLDVDRTATLRACYDDEGRRPFELELPEGRIVGIGLGEALAAEVDRVIKRREGIRFASRLGVSRGRGKRRFYKTLRPMAHRLDNCKDAFACDLADRMAKLCKEHNCGSVVFHCPSRYMRQQTWLQKRGVTLTWDRLIARLQGRCLKDGIKLDVVDFKKADAEAG